MVRINTPASDSPLLEGPSLGAVLQRDTGKPEGMCTGAIQFCAGTRCVMQSEGASNEHYAVRRANYLVETFSTYVARNGVPVNTKGKMRAEGLLEDIRTRSLSKIPSIRTRR